MRAVNGADSPESALSARAKAIATGLIRTARAGKHGVFERGILKLERRGGGYYWISLNGDRILSGNRLFDADELQPKFIDAMERAGR
jgi:hypothetical protein